MTHSRVTRQQLAEFLPSQALIKAFEALFEAVNETTPATVTEAQLSADSAQFQVAEALGQLATIASELSLALHDGYTELVEVDNYIPPVSYGTMAEQNADGVEITGGSVKVNSLTNGNVGALISSSVTLDNGAAAAAGTLSNAPAAGNPTKWIPINDNGVTRYIPAW